MPSSNTNKYQRKPKTSVFHIRIGNNIDKIDLKDPSFLKILQQQYATKYLQSLGVESTSKNIFKILKQYPIQNCEIIQSRLNGGLYTDTITIIPKSYNQSNQNPTNQKQMVSNEMLQVLDLKRIGQKKYRSQKSNNEGNSEGYNLNRDQVMQESILNQQGGKKNNTNNSNFRVKNVNTRTNSNAFISDKSGLNEKQKSSTNFFGSNDELAFAKTKSNIKSQTSPQNQNQKLRFLNFNIQDIKSRYIFPFNDNFKRKTNYKLQDNFTIREPQDPNVVYEWKVFHFPFSQVNFSKVFMKELQNPINAKISDISSFLDSFYLQFPSHVFPPAPQPPKKSASSLTQNNINTSLINPQINISSNGKTSQYNSLSSGKKNITSNYTEDKSSSGTIMFTKQQIDSMFSILRSQSMVKMIGVFLHLAYWCIFGGVNPVQIESSMKKKMYTMMFQTIEYFKIKVENKKMWAVLVFPMVLLVIKMATHYFLFSQYSKIFQSQEAVKLGFDDLVIDKVMYLIEKMFDQSNINGRFIFLQSQITGAKGTFLKDKQYISKRIFGTSPTLQIILPNPKNGKARAIMAKNDQRQTLSIGDNRRKSKQAKLHLIQETSGQKRQYQEKLLTLALNKINNHLVSVHGQSFENNPIIKLKQ